MYSHMPADAYYITCIHAHTPTISSVVAARGKEAAGVVVVGFGVPVAARIGRACELNPWQVCGSK